jgi:hypothetical protein
MKVAQKNESSGRYVASTLTVKEKFLNRGTSEFKDAVVFSGDVVFKGDVSGLDLPESIPTKEVAPTKILYCDTCPTSKYPPPLASTFGMPFQASKDGTYKFHVEIAFMQNSESKHPAFLTADFYVNGKAISEKTPESYEKFVLTRTLTLKRGEKVELRICEDFFSGTTYILDPPASYYEIVFM